MPYPSWTDLENRYQIQTLSTEQPHSLTQNLSELYKEKPKQAIETLLKVDQDVENGLEGFIRNDLSPLSNQWKVAISNGGRLFFIGAGSSGRVAIDLAAKARQAFSTKQIIGLIAGGATAFVRPQENQEDQEDAGKEGLEAYQLSQKDHVILISASGVCAFNRGAGAYAKSVGATLHLFTSSKTLAPATKTFIEQTKANLICVDTGPQAITGSTRLQAATTALACLGLALTQAHGAATTAEDFLKGLQAVNQALKGEVSKLAALSAKAGDVFLKQGAITYLAAPEALRESVMDASEIAPTFSTQPPRFITENSREPAAFRAYGSEDLPSTQLWENLIGRPLSDTETEQVSKLLLNTSDLGTGSFQERSQLHNPLTIGIALDDPRCDATLNIPAAPADPMGILQSIALKQLLNAFSNAVMLKAGRIFGNRMIYVSPSNHKLLYRTTLLIADMLRSRGHSTPPLEELYTQVIESKEAFKNNQVEGKPSLPVVLLVLEKLKCL